MELYGKELVEAIKTEGRKNLDYQYDVMIEDNIIYILKCNDVTGHYGSMGPLSKHYGFYDGQCVLHIERQA